MYEAMKHGLEYNNPPHVQARTQDNEFDGPDDDDYLENSDDEKATSTVLTPLNGSQNDSRIETINAHTEETTNESTTIIEVTTGQTKQSSSLNNLLRSLAKNATKLVDQTTSTLSEIPKNVKTIAIARSSCTSCVGNIQNYHPLALRQGDAGGDSVKKSGYDYDENKCKIINGRILCGYNKNVGEIQDDTVILNIDSNCQMRDDRIECGYVPGNKPAGDVRSIPSVNDTSAALYDPLPEKNFNKSEILRDSSIILTNGVRDSPESLGYPTNDNNNNISEPDSNKVKLKQTISEISSQQNVLRSEKVVGIITTASTEKSVDIIERSNTEQVEQLNTHFDNVNNAIGNFESTTSPQFYDNPGVIDYVTTVNESINFVAEAQVQRRVEEDVQLSDTNGPAFDKNIDRNYLQNPNSIKEKNEPHVEVTSDASNYKRVTRCVEIGDRIVCYNIQLNDITPHM